MKLKRILSGIICSILSGGCLNLSPQYTPPDLTSPLAPEYKEEQVWKTAKPKDALDRGPWWEMFEDSTLNGLMLRLNAANQNIAVAASNLRQARAQIGIARSALFPFVSAPASVTRTGSERQSQQTITSYGVNAQWEIGFWNALPALEGAKAQAEASAADYATTRLAMQAELAQAYFQLRMLDGQRDIYESTVTAYARAVELTRSQFRGGLVTRMDMDQAESQQSSAEAQLAALVRQRAEVEHGIAVLVGWTPSGFSLERSERTAFIPDPPDGLPLSLLERRPDVAAAERNVAAANERIGLARAAWLPSLVLGGEHAGQATGWHSAPLWIWSVGPSAVLTMFQGGRRLAESESAWAAYEGDVANYRQTVLQAVKDVEDNLAALRHLQTEADAQIRAVRSSKSALRIAMSQYQGGMTTYLQVVASQTAALSAERAAIEVHGQRLIATVNLFKALGGGWKRDELEALLQGKGGMEGRMRR